MNENPRDRWRAVNKRTASSRSDDIFKMWEDQRKMQAEDKRIEQELAEAKKKARELKKTLYKNKFGEQKNKSVDVVSKSTKLAKKHLNKAYAKARNNYKKLAIAGLVLVVAIGGLAFIKRDTPQTGTLGESASGDLKIQEDLPREKPAFSLLYPSGKSSKDYDVVRISPPEAAASYAYLDRFSEDTQIFRVTQQEIPDGFNLEEAATGFQATSIIEVDGNKIYHGYSESGGIQSILFIKNDKLILIRSTQKYSDDQWAAYYLALK